MTLQFNVAQLLKADIGQTRTYDFALDEAMDLGDGQATDIRGRVKFTLTNFGILATGSGCTSVQLTCARCLERFESPIYISFEEEFQPSIDIATGLPSSVPRSDTAFPISQNHTVHLGEAIRQHILLGVEIIPICRQDCAGLCPACGVNRNQEGCNCAQENADNPFAALGGILTESTLES